MRQIKRLSILMLVVVCFSAARCKKTVTGPTPVKILSPLTQAILDSTQLISQVFRDTIFQVTDGVKETDIQYLSMKGYAMRVFILAVDLNNPKLSLEGVLPYGETQLSSLMQPLPEMASYVDSAGHRVVGAVNADFFDRSTAVPRGILVIDGNILKTTWYNDRSATFIGVFKDGSPFIGTRQDFDSLKTKFTYALGSGPLLVDHHELQLQTDLTTEPRTAAGLTDDEVMYFVVVDGRNFYWSNGMTLTEMGELLRACGSERAVNLDGGGSSTFLIRNPLAPVLQVRNMPSDGSNRPLGDGWMVISNQP